MKKIKICHFVNLITGTADGVYTHILMLLRALPSDKFEQILIFHGGSKVSSEMSEIGIKTYVIHSLNLKLSVRVFWDFLVIIKREQIDIIHAHMLKPYAIAGLVNILLRKNVIFNYHGLFINNPFNTTVEKLFYKVAHYLIYIFDSVQCAIVPSFGSKERLLKETRLFRDIKVYYNGYLRGLKGTGNPTHIIEGLNLKHFVIGMVSRIYYEKRIDRALLIINKLIKSGGSVSLIILGDGELLDKMKSESKKLGIDNSVHFLGYQPDVISFYQYFDILLITSDWEGLPMVVWEAMAEGVPIVSSDVGGIREIIEPNKCGYVFDKDNPDQAVELIKSLYVNEISLKSLGENGKKALSTKYSPKNFTDFFTKLYTELALK